MAEEKQQSSRGDDFLGYVILGGIALVIALVLSLPGILGTGAYFLTRNYLNRRDYVIIAIVGIITTILTARTYAISYGSWMWEAAHKNFDFAAFPWPIVLTMAAAITGIIGLALGTRIAERLPWGFRSRKPSKRETILPSDKEKQKVTSIVSAPGSLVVQADANSVVTPSTSSDVRAFPLGVDSKGQTVMLTESQMRTHAMILGATGSGKTETIKVMAGGLLDLGWSGTVLDLKEDVAEGGLRDWCNVYASHHGQPYQELRLSNPDSETWFNPLAGMGPDEIRDTILALQEFDDAFWQALNKELLGQIVNLLVWANQVDPQQFPYPSMYDLGKILSLGDLKNATKRHRAAVLGALPYVTKEDFRALENPSQAMQQSATGYGSKLTQFYDTQAGRTVLRPGMNNERRLIDVTQEGLTYIGLDSQGKGDLTKVISAAVLQRMSVYAAQRITNQVSGGIIKPRFLIVDEANWVNRTIVQSLLSRARGAGIAMVLCTQGPKDWIDKQGDDWGKLTQNVNVAVIMAQGEPESAELCADFIGKIYKKQQSEMVRESRGLLFNKATRNSDGEVLESYSVQEKLAHLVDPDDLRRMGVGEAILRVGKPEEWVSWVRMPMRDPTLKARRG